MNDTNNDYYLYQGKIYHCSECTTEAEVYGADCGKALLFLDELEGGNYVNADDCVKVAPNFWQHFKFNEKEMLQRDSLFKQAKC